MVPAVEGVEAAIRDATALGPNRVSSANMEFAIRQVVEVAVRALSPGIDAPQRRWRCWTGWARPCATWCRCT